MLLACKFLHTHTSITHSFLLTRVFSNRIILGGGIIKHHTCNANLMRNGANFSVFINTGQEFDGSDSGASPDEAISWGKIKIDAKPVKICSDASLVFPLIVTQTFYKEYIRQQQQAANKQ